MSGNTVAELIECVTRQLPQFAPNAVTGHQRYFVVGFQTEQDLYKDLGDTIEIHMVPQMLGGKNSGLGQILLGAVLIGVSFIPGIGPTVASMLLKVGAMQILGGITAMLAPTPSDDRDEERSKYLGAPRNTTKIGTRISILYGEYRWGGHYLSFDINAIEFRGSNSSSKSGGK